jgi:adenylate kinase family enzyme
VVDRLNLYNSETKPLIDHYDAKGVLQNFTGTESDIIYPQIQAYMKDVLKL